MASSDRSRAEDIYDDYGVGLYRQALLTLGDPALAEHVVCDVIVDECVIFAPRGRGEADARHRLAESAFRRCQQLAAGHGRSPGRPPSAGVADCIDPGGLLSGAERGALGLVLFGGLGYVPASKVVGIRPRDMAVLLHALLRRLTTSSAGAVEDGKEVRRSVAGGPRLGRRQPGGCQCRATASPGSEGHRVPGRCYRPVKGRR
jgi:hypothetical protein